MFCVNIILESRFLIIVSRGKKFWGPYKIQRRFRLAHNVLKDAREVHSADLITFAATRFVSSI